MASNDHDAMTIDVATVEGPTLADEATTTVLLCGVGGQGTILAAHILADACLANGLDVKVSEIHGMAQRGGSVVTVVRFGREVHAMVADLGSTDVLVAFETTEALRYLPFLKEGGTLIVNDESMKSLPVLTGRATMPVHAREDLEALGATLVPAHRIALEAGNARAENVALIGALAATLPFPLATWEDAVSRHVPPKTVDINLKALRAGYEF